MFILSRKKMNEEPHGLCSISEILEYMFPEITSEIKKRYEKQELFKANKITQMAKKKIGDT